MMGRAVFGTERGLMGELLGGRWDGIRRWLGGEAKEEKKERKGAGGFFVMEGILEVFF